MESDTELQATLASLQAVGQAALTREERIKRQRSLDSLGVPPFGQKLQVLRPWVPGVAVVPADAVIVPFSVATVPVGVAILQYLVFA